MKRLRIVSFLASLLFLVSCGAGGGQSGGGNGEGSGGPEYWSVGVME